MSGLLNNIFKKDKDKEEEKEPKQKKETKSKKKTSKKKKNRKKVYTKGTVLKRPLVSEKSRNLTADNKYVFIVETNANKAEIKKEVEERWNVTVESVNTSKINKKSRRVPGKRIKKARGSVKKAIVTLSEGDSIDIFAV